MLTVADLILKLQEFDPALPVVVSGFDEWGFCDLDTIQTVEIAPVELKSHGPDYEVAHTTTMSVTGPAFTALHLDF